ncbi:Coiled-coil domain-containing protein 25 [Coemansia spiralis]|uniref:Coiled-coil domain-containing protein 25 n=2 Tax=Coemansia TaxID=4863 RepID=A0A9W8G8Q6_9FUNG|nr:hypothetical protein BX070DRAFT_240347 [Coemansia spiralis]KAJ1991765.1 Coiled-coil domain-containing protein 25 [Coemansia umbellata]KAJ2621730.1 Coiled-coil domain-containing protein 25 [Coemansia sp. RSA 1358]KAJ2677483.1 Coiled-coil domain-containing protein 25 [Coemansia spiralis]
MVYYFTSNVVDPPATIYMGKDKFENEDLIKHGWPEDVWFHVDKLSSAHVYLRLPKDCPYTWESIPEPLLDDLAQICKANSIEGNKKNNLAIIYTPWSNLLKRGDMATGQVSFKLPKLVKRVHVVERLNSIVNRLNKTKNEEHPDFYQQRQDRDREEKRLRKRAANARQAEERKIVEERQKEKESQDYSKVFEAAAKKSKAKGLGQNKADDIFGNSDDDDESSLGAHASDFDDFI